MRYIFQTVSSIVGVFLMIFLALVAVFGIEKFTYILETAFRYRMSLGHFIVLYAAMLPDAADFVLPIALVIASYVIILRKRENREFLVWSSAGVGHRNFLLTAFAAGLVGMIFCIGISGFVKPAASLSFRQNYALAYANAVSTGLPGGNFYQQNDSVMYVAPASGERHTEMRVFSFDGDRLQRVTASNCASLRAIGREVLSRLCDARVYLFGLDAQTSPTLRLRPVPAPAAPARTDAKSCRFCAGTDGRLEVVRLQAGESSIRFTMDSVFGTLGNSRLNDRSLLDLLATHDGAFGSATDARRGATYLLLGLTCMLAVGVGLGAVAATAPRTGVFALGGGLGIVIAAMVAVRSEVLLVGPVTDPRYLIALILGAGLLCAVAIAAIAVLLHDRLITPMFVRG